MINLNNYYKILAHNRYSINVISSSPPYTTGGTLVHILTGKLFACALFSVSTSWHDLSHALEFPSPLFPQENVCDLSAWVMHGSLLTRLMCLAILEHFGDIVIAKITGRRASETLNILQYSGNSTQQEWPCHHVSRASHCKEFFKSRHFKMPYGGDTERTFLRRHKTATLPPLCSLWLVHLPEVFLKGRKPCTSIFPHPGNWLTSHPISTPRVLCPLQLYIWPHGLTTYNKLCGNHPMGKGHFFPLKMVMIDLWNNN